MGRRINTTVTGFTVLIALAIAYGVLVFFDTYPNAAEIRSAGGTAPALLRDSVRSVSYAAAFVLVFSVFVDASRWVRRIATATAILGGLAFAIVYFGLPVERVDYRTGSAASVSWLHGLVLVILYVGACTSIVSVPWLFGTMIRSIHTHAPG